MQTFGTLTIEKTVELLKSMGFQPYVDEETKRMYPRRWVKGEESVTLRVLSTTYPGRVQVVGNA